MGFIYICIRKQFSRNRGERSEQNQSNAGRKEKDQ